MSATRLRALLLGSAGIAVLLLLGVANSSPTVESAPEGRRPAVVLDASKPVTGVNPFKSPTKPKPPIEKPVEEPMSVPVVPAGPLPDIQVEPIKVEVPNPIPLPDLKVEGVIMGSDPVAVIRLGSESFVLRVGESFGDGFKVLSIRDSEVRIKGLNREFVLRTSG